MPKAIFGAGCFWGVEDEFRALRGVTATRVGFAGGTVDAPTYEVVCAGGTGHAEVVEVDFEASALSYAELLDFFFRSHDAAQRVPEQYRSIVVCTTPEQFLEASSWVDAIRDAAGHGRRLTTEVLIDVPFFEADETNQHYFEKQRTRVRELTARCGLE
jgi:peptide-methionine (S)-S-oxide reductase